MQNLISFISKYHTLLLFLGLELLCLNFIIRHNHFQRSTTLNTTNKLVGGTLQKASDVRNYINLKEVNDSLLSENVKLQNELSFIKMAINTQMSEQFCKEDVDSADSQLFSYIGAEVINRTINRANNYVTINRGTRHGIQPEMGALGCNGLVGSVVDVSENFASIMPLIHQDSKVSARLKRNNYKGSLKWDLSDPEFAILDDIAKHLTVHIGDTIVTSGFSDFFPPDVMVGVIESWSSPVGDDFLEITVRLSTNFNRLQYVYVIDYKNKDEQKALEERSKND